MHIKSGIQAATEVGCIQNEFSSIGQTLDVFVMVKQNEIDVQPRL